jgi:nitronate monooxygenase
MSVTSPPAAHATRFTRLVGSRLPIQSAPMPGVVRDATLPAAVAAAGGHGMFPATFLSPAYLERVIDELSAQTGAFGVNFVTLGLDRDCLELAAARSPYVDLYFGDPEPALVEAIHAGGAIASWQVSSREQAKAAVAAGCDVVVVQGAEAGGRPRSELGLLPLLDSVLGTVEVPVMAAGGIGSARAVAAAMAAGASAVRAGTRFIAASESAAHPAYKHALVQARAEDAVLTRSFSAGDPVESTARVLRSALAAAHELDAEQAGVVVMGDRRVPAARFSSLLPTEGSTGALDAMALYAGQSVDGVRAVEPAADIVAELAVGLPVTED